MAAPVTKIDPSRAYATSSPDVQAIVVMSPVLDGAATEPVFISTKEPVP